MRYDRAVRWARFILCVGGAIGCVIVLFRHGWDAVPILLLTAFLDGIAHEVQP